MIGTKINGTVLGAGVYSAHQHQKLHLLLKGIVSVYSVTKHNVINIYKLSINHRNDSLSVFTPHSLIM